MYYVSKRPTIEYLKNKDIDRRQTIFVSLSGIGQVPKLQALKYPTQSKDNISKIQNFFYQ